MAEEVIDEDSTANSETATVAESTVSTGSATGGAPLRPAPGPETAHAAEAQSGSAPQSTSRRTTEAASAPASADTTAPENASATTTQAPPAPETPGAPEPPPVAGVQAESAPQPATRRTTISEWFARWRGQRASTTGDTSARVPETGPEARPEEPATEEASQTSSAEKPMEPSDAPPMTRKDFDKLEDEFFKEAQTNLYTFERGTPTEAEAANEKVIQQMNAWPQPKVSPKKMGGMTDKQIRELLAKVKENSVVKNCSLYDPTGVRQFCFGKAVAAHVEAVNMRLDKNQIRKLWAVGTFKSGELLWAHHVTTVVRRVDGKWIVVDPLFAEPMTMEEWYAKMASKQNPDNIKNMRIFSTRAERFGPEYTDKMKPINLGVGNIRDDAYNNFFRDLMKTFRKKKNNSSSPNPP